ncbi:MAG TPA: SDR family NAD(P)-dependent oxidoreductase [Oligoflexus sp.]|uniref:SDR family NAD(P)-dependent oxidoreductase n=1 Tax=Oligoflexus sp. TaxID=1971216 RepID=UPI002D7F897A|nr:SDR family NAD(P)-dependent oxidoreductase [Oligoflexus sp.]HET9238190.1 SDR family NAD(P)-dependent oxidoreductase [Oligoflexus sp.]
MEISKEQEVFRKALAKLKELKDENEELKALANEPIAIVGMGIRLPDVQSLQDFWQILRQGRSLIGPVPAQRWKDDTASLEKLPPYGSYFRSLECFDTENFGIHKQELDNLDPQQALTLEVACEALQDAGISRQSVKGSSTGVFIGVCSNDYAYQQQLPDNQFSVSGSAFSFIAGRLSFALDIQGPSIAVDTACSSSLVAVHQACQSLRSQDCDMALAGGVNLVGSPRSILRLKKTRALSPSGQCRTFDKGADGFVRGEGCGVVVLKRLRDAMKDGDQIHAVIRSSLVSHDGTGTGLTAPHVKSQRDLLSRALERAGLKPHDVSYIETHGTGTALGDPIECEAIHQALGARSVEAGPCYLGALKPNIGHTEGAAGIVGLIKLALVLRKGIIPPNVSFSELNPLIQLPAGHYKIPLQETAWPQSRKRCGGVSSFGMGGTNAHVVAEAFVPQDLSPSVESSASSSLYSIVLAADDEDILEAYKKRLLSVVKSCEITNLSQIAATLSRRHRDELGQRAITVRTMEELEQQLAQVGSFGETNHRPFVAAGSVSLCSLPPRPWRYQLQTAGSTHEASKPKSGSQELDSAESLPSAWVYKRRWVEAELMADEARPVFSWDLQRHKLFFVEEPSAVLDARKEVSWDELRQLKTPGFRLLVPWPDLSITDLLPEGQAAAAMQRLFQFLAEFPRELSSRLEQLLLVTHNVWSPGADAIDLLWGALPSLRLEMPHLPLAIVDINDRADPRDQEAIWTILRSRPDHSRILICQGEILSEQLLPTDLTLRLGALDPGLTYVVSGGLGAVGQTILTALMEQGARRLAVLTRRKESELSAMEQQFLRGIRQKAEILVLATDMGLKPSVYQAIQQLSQQNPLGLHVYHAAGNFMRLDRQSLNQESFKDLSAGKVLGAQYLLDLAQDFPIKEILFLSSASAAWGMSGYALYGAVNGALNQLARLGRRQGIRVRSIEAGPWNLQGMGSDAQRHTLEKSGCHLLEPRLTAKLLIAFMQSEPRCLLLADMQWQKFLPLLERQRHDSFFTKLRTVASTEKPLHATRKDHPMNELQLVDLIKNILQRITRIALKDLDSKKGLFDIGIDSLTSISLLEELEKIFSIELGIATLYNFPSIERLAAHLASLELTGPALHSDAPRKQDKAESPVLPSSGASTSCREGEAGQGRDIAVIGMACRFPGGIKSPEELWDKLVHGVDCVSPSASRWELCGIDPQSSRALGHDMGLLDQVEKFDATYFGIPGREALSMDPQQRILLELAQEAIDDAGLEARDLSQKPCGVFIGASNNDYAELLKSQGLDAIDAYYASGTALNSLAGRISYHFGLQGPALVTDTACSSSLVALHLAVQSLRKGESKLALAAGVNVILAPFHNQAAVQGHMLSDQSRCQTFDADADGFVRSEGCGVLLLQPLSEALAQGHRIYGVIKGSAVNHDGRSNGFTVPNGAAQKRVYEEALADAAVDANQVSYVEAHGTGTAIGDPIEVDSIQSVYGKANPQGLLVGSIKSNIGHMESAAGMGSIMKILLAFQHGMIPGNLHYKKRNPLIKAKNITVVDHAVSWPNHQAVKRAAVSGFGFSGVNAHVIFEGPETSILGSTEKEEEEWTVVVSGHSEPSLKENIARLDAYLQRHPESSLRDLAFSLGQRRREEFVASWTVSSLSHLLSQLKNPTALSRANGKLAFLCSGQGSQHHGMGRYLYENHPTFRHVIDSCSSLLEGQWEYSLTDLMFDPQLQDLVHETQYTQALLFAYEVALGRLLFESGWKPDYLIGHSVGEYAAATLAGMLSLEDGLRLIAKRGELMQLTDAGGMLALSLDEVSVLSLLQEADLKLDIAAVNGPKQLVVSGPEAEIGRLLSLCQERGLRAKALTVSHAFHSATMDRILKAFSRELQRVTLNPAKIPIINNVSGKASSTLMLEKSYWIDQLRGTVRFHAACQEAIALGVTHFVEIGPDQTLSILGSLSGGDAAVQWIASQARNQDQAQSFQKLKAKLFDIAPHAQEKLPSSGMLLSLPPYAWDHKVYWPELPKARRISARGQDFVHLGKRWRLPESRDEVFATSRRSMEPLYLDDHRLYGFVVAPAASHISMVASAFEPEILQGQVLELQHVSFPQALVLDEQDEAELQLWIQRGSQSSSIKCLSNKGDTWETHLQAAYLLHPRPRAQHFFSIEAFQQNARCIEGHRFYKYFTDLGYTLGPAFQWIESIWQKGTTSLSRLRLPDMREAADPYALYPGLIDSCFQTLAGMMFQEGVTQADALAIPFSADLIRIHGRAEGSLWCFVQGRSTHGHDYDEGDIQLFDQEGRLILEVEGFRIRHAKRSLLEAGLKAKEAPAFELQWEARPDSIRGALQRTNWKIFTGSEEWAQNLIQALEQGGALAKAWDDLSAFDKALQGESASFSVVDARFLHETAPAFISSENCDQATARQWELFSSIKQAVAQGTLQRYVLLTRSRQDPEGAVQFEALRALSLALMAEFKSLSCQVISMEPAVTADDLARELDAMEAEIALQLGPRGASVMRAKAVKTACTELKLLEKASYIITGGFGALGQETARDFIRRGGGRIYLLGRRPYQSEWADALEKLGGSPEQICYRQVDISERSALAQLLDEIAASSYPLKGVVHAAGTLADKSLLELSADEFRAVLAGKVWGALHLHELTRDLPLDMFVLYSSQSSFCGNAGQANYAFANGILDGIARMRQGQGLPGLAISWSSWHGDGMAQSQALQIRMQRLGITPLQPHEALPALKRGQPNNCAHLLVARLDWDRYLTAQFQKVPKLFEGLLSQDVQGTQQENEAAWLKQLQSMPANARLDWLKRNLQTLVAAILREPESQLSFEYGFNQLGFDSIMVLDLKAKLDHLFASNMPATLGLDFPDIDKLASYLLQRFGLEVPVSSQAERAELSDEELIRMAAAELSES